MRCLRNEKRASLLKWVAYNSSMPLRQAHTIKKGHVSHVRGATINGKKTQAMVDTSVSHNFMKTKVTRKLVLKIGKSNGMLKPVNTQAKPFDGVVQKVELQLGHKSA